MLTSAEKPQLERELLCSTEIPNFSHLKKKNCPQCRKVLLKVLLTELVKLCLSWTLILLELSKQ